LHFKTKISLDVETIAKHQEILLTHPEFAEKLRTIFENKPEKPEQKVKFGLKSCILRRLAAAIKFENLTADSGF